MKLENKKSRGPGLLRKGISSLRHNGVRVTTERTIYKLLGIDPARCLATHPLFTEAELQAQREHSFPRKLRFSIAVPLYNTPEDFLRAMIESVIGQTYADWELCIADGSDESHPEVGGICREYAARDSRIRYRRLARNCGISGNTNACLELAEGDYVGLFDHDDLLHPAALYEVMRVICETDADFIYTDENTFQFVPEDAYNPHLKPDYAPDTLCSNNYICHFTVFRRALLEETGGFEPSCDGSQDHDMIMRLTEKAKRIVHIPEILYYWRAHSGSVADSIAVKPYVIDAGVRSVRRRLERMGLEGEVSPVRPDYSIYRVRYAIKGTPKISILIPNSEHLSDLRSCLDSIFAKTSYPNYEIVIVENNSTSRELFSYYDALLKEHNNVKVVVWPGTGFNYPAINNFGAKHCTGEYLLLLNNDTEVISPDWLQEMLMFAQREDVGAVGAKLYYPDDTVQHAGVGVGLGDAAGHFFRGFDRDAPGYMRRLYYAQNLSAVTAACMLLRRDVWDRVNGLDEGFAVAYNDVDLCLRIRREGFLVVWTPFAELYHYESKSRGSDLSPKNRRRYKAEVARFHARWKKELERGDPYFNPGFSLDREDFLVNPNSRIYALRTSHE